MFNKDPTFDFDGDEVVGIIAPHLAIAFELEFMAQTVKWHDVYETRVNLTEYASSSP